MKVSIRSRESYFRSETPGSTKVGDEEETEVKHHRREKTKETGVVGVERICTTHIRVESLKRET